MRSVLSIYFFAIFIQTLYSQEVKNMEVKELLAKHTYSIQLDKEVISGDGAEKLFRDLKQHDILLFGENHGVVEIAEFAQLLYQKFSDNKKALLVTEVGPATASEMWELLQKNSYEEFMDESLNLHSVPFFFLKQEVPLLKETLQNFPDEQGVWGLDQEFMASAPILLRRLEKLATTEDEKDIVRKFRSKQRINPFLVGMGSGEILFEMEKVFSNSKNNEAKRITQQIVQSYKIYQLNSDGNYNEANETREALLKENFNWYVKNYQDSLPKLFFKFGSFHLYNNEAPTVKEALGGYVNNWATSNNKKTLSIMVDAVSGKTINPLTGFETDIEGQNYWEKSLFRAALQSNTPTLFYLKPLHKHPKLEPLSKKTKQIINGYDYLLLIPNGTAQEFLDGTLVTWGYGIPILIVLLILIFGLFYMIRKFYKKRKNKK